MFKKLMALAAITLALPTHASIVEVGNLNIINQLGNASDGLRYLDLSISQNGATGFNPTDALAHAQTFYSNARFATASEFDDLFQAAGITYDGAETAGDVFGPGPDSVNISTGSNYDGGVLADILGRTIPGFAAAIWSDPDGSEDPTTTYDFLFLIDSRAQLEHTVVNPLEVPSGQLAYLIVSEVPVPAAAWLFGSALIGMAGVRRTKRSK